MPFFQRLKWNCIFECSDDVHVWYQMKAYICAKMKAIMRFCRTDVHFRWKRFLLFTKSAIFSKPSSGIVSSVAYWPKFPSLHKAGYATTTQEQNWHKIRLNYAQLQALVFNLKRRCSFSCSAIIISSSVSLRFLIITGFLSALDSFVFLLCGS